MDAGADRLTAVVSMRNIDSAIAVCIYNGRPGISGQLIVPLTQSQADAKTSQVTFPKVPASDIVNALARNLYFAVLMTAAADGLIRGQIRP
ncbi:MAG: CHRD domain-containing protein [Burkholderiaceae bacterium]